MRAVVIAFFMLAMLVLAMVAGAVTLAGRYVRERLVTVGEPTTIRETIRPETARNLDAMIQMGIGELRVTSDAESPALEAELINNVNELTPTIDYHEEGSIGYATVRQAEGIALPNLDHFEDALFMWDLQLGQDLPVSMTVDVGAGAALLELQDLPLTNLTVDVGAGATVVDLRGTRPHSLTASISTGTGGITLFLPVDVGVSVEANTGIGGIDAIGLSQSEAEDDVWVNPHFDSEQPRVVVEVNAGMGGIELLADPAHAKDPVD